MEQITDLIRAGVSCFKIEGRLKGPEYVALTTQVYRSAVDVAWQDIQLQQKQWQQQQQQGAGVGVVADHADASAADATAESSYSETHRVNSSSSSSGSSSSGGSSRSSSVHAPLLARLPAAAATPSVASSSTTFEFDFEQQVMDLKQVFARGQDEVYGGLTPGFLQGVQHQMLVRGRAPRHRGLCLGRVGKITNKGVVLDDILVPVKRGDGVVFDRGNPEAEEEGGHVFDVYQGGKRLSEGAAAAGSKGVELVFGDGQINLRRIKVCTLSSPAICWHSVHHACAA